MEQRKQFLINAAYVLLIVGIAYIVIKYLLGLITPFVIGFIVALVLQRVINFLSTKLRLPKKLAAVCSVLLFYAVVVILLVWVSMSAVAGIRDLVERLPAIYSNDVEPVLLDIFESLERLMARFDLTLVQILEDFHLSLSQSLGKIVSDVSSLAISTITSTVSLVPKMFLGVVLSVISSVFFAMDFELIISFFTSLLPQERQGLVQELQIFASRLGGKYLKSYALIMLITFTEVALGLSILQVNGALTIAAFTAVMDVLPVLGTGGVLIPWAIFALVKGNLFLGIGLFVLYVIITVIRNIIEPKLVGQQIGLHPIAMLLGMYVGVRLFGVVGLFALPITILLVKHLYEQGRLNPHSED